jgi:beta-lactamase regulating signal transducer with metallopeptidase domain
MTMSLLENLFAPGTIERLGWMLVHFLWQAAIVALLLAAMLRLLRHAGANLRYAVACSALALMVVLPLVTMRFVVVAGPVAEAGPALVDLSPSPVALLPTVGTVEKIVAETPAPAAAPIEVPASPAAADLPASAVAWQERIVSLLEPALPYLVLGWVIGVFGLSAWHLGGWTQLQRLKRRMVREVGNPLGHRLEELSLRLGVSRAVRLLESALIEVPTVVGWLRPVILLPASALTGLRPEQLEAILAHELAHIRRHDYLVNVLQTVVEILGFYHPALWWVSHRIRIERENCCDDQAVQVCGSSLQYARALACMEEIRHGGTDLAMAATGGSLMARIARLLGHPAVDDRRFAWLPGLVALLLVVAIIMPAAFALATASQPRGSTLDEPAVKATMVKPEANAEEMSNPTVQVQADADSRTVPSNDDRAHVEMAFKFIRVRPEQRLDRETLMGMTTILGEVLRAHDPSQSGRNLEITVEEALKRYVVARPLSEETEKALVAFLSSRGYLMSMLAAPRVSVQNGKLLSFRLTTGRIATVPLLGADMIDLGTDVKVTPRIADGNQVALEMRTELTEGAAGPGQDSGSTVSRASAETRVTIPNDRYMIWAAVELPPDAMGTDQRRESLYVMARPLILPPAQGRGGVAGDREPASARSRQVLLDVRTITLERDALSNLSVEWGSPTTRAGVFPGPSAGGAQSPGSAGWPWSVRLGYAPDRIFTESLLAALDQLQKNHQATVSSQQILAQDGHQAQVKALTEEWSIVTTPSPQSQAGPRKTETGTIVAVRPHIGDTNDIILEMAVDGGQRQHAESPRL